MTITIDDTYRFHEYGLFIPSNMIYIGGEQDDENGYERGVDAKCAQQTIKNLTILQSHNPKEIRIVINCIGGDEYHGLAIYDAIKGLRCKTIGIGIGNVMSMGSIIIQACTERYLTKNSTMLIHDGTFGEHVPCEASPHNTLRIAKEGMYLTELVYEIYHSRMIKNKPNTKIKDIKDMCLHDTFLRPQQAVDLGLADKVIEKL